MKWRPTPVYNVLNSAKQRCVNVNDPQYFRYGGRGIEFRFKSLKSAETWISENLGPRPEGKSLDRIDNDGHYEPGNLRWATAKEQCENRRHCPTCRCLEER